MQVCVDCSADDRTIYVTQQAHVLGKRFSWSICVPCWVRSGQPTAPEAEPRPATIGGLRR